MKRLFAAVLLLLSTLASGAGFDSPATWKKAVINANGNTVVCVSRNVGPPCVFGGYRVLAAAGAFTMDVYDNATTNSGQKVISALSVNAAADSVLPNGIEMVNGITVAMSGDPTDALILIFYR